jgi:hypothetical protein
MDKVHRMRLRTMMLHASWFFGQCCWLDFMLSSGTPREDTFSVIGDVIRLYLSKYSIRTQVDSFCYRLRRTRTAKHQTTPQATELTPSRMSASDLELYQIWLGRREFACLVQICTGRTWLWWCGVEVEGIRDSDLLFSYSSI